MKHLKYIFSSLKNDFSKLFAIVLTVLLGIGFMSGLLQAGEDLKGGQNLFYKSKFKFRYTYEFFWMHFKRFI